MIKGFMPKYLENSAMSHCLMLYDWEREIDESWIEVSESIFDALEMFPVEGTGTVSGRSAHGPYLKSKGKLKNFLKMAIDCGEFDVRIRSAKTHPDDQAFPSDLEISFSGSRIRRKKLCIAARRSYIPSLNYLINAIEKIVMPSTGACYGAALNFPAKFGPSFYLSSIVFSPPGVAWDANQDYANRITRWRDRTAHGALSPRAGYFREIYEINLLTAAHLEVHFQNRPFGEFAKSVGIVRPLSYGDGMYRWDISSDELQKVQELMEGSGLVLSS